MLTVKTTPNLYGISLQGDYEDLNALYDSISRYLDFYQENNEFYPYHEYEYLLSLNYDIRHAYMGSRDIDIRENNASQVGVIAESIFEITSQSKKDFSDIRRKFKNGNLYFSVDILYPLVFHYLVSLDNITIDEPLPIWFNNTPDGLENYNSITANSDRTLIRHFLSLLWANAAELFGNEKALTAMEYYEYSEFLLAPHLYTDALIHWQLAHFGKLSEEEKRCFLLKALYEIIDSDELKSRRAAIRIAHRHFTEASDGIKKTGLPGIPDKRRFYRKLDKFLADGRPFYESVFDEFLEKNYGRIEDEDPEM